MKEILKSSHGYYVYEDEEIVKGYMLLGDSSEGSSNSIAIELVALYIEPIFKRLGCGSELIKKCEEMEIDSRKNEIRLWVLENNNSSREFYEKHGFSENGTFVHLVKFNQKEVRYIKQL